MKAVLMEAIEKGHTAICALSPYIDINVQAV